MGISFRKVGGPEKCAQDLKIHYFSGWNFQLIESTSLLKDEDEEKKRRVANLESEEAKWTEIKSEVDQRRAREQQEHNNYVYEAKVCSNQYSKASQ